MCEICLATPCLKKCPNYTITKSRYYCSFCSDKIDDNEEYIENLDGECIHYECIRGIRYLLEWLGHDIKTMEEMENI